MHLQMSRETRLTGFSRLILFLLIIIPGAYIGSHFITGEELSLDAIKNLFNNSEEKKEVVVKEETEEKAAKNDKETFSFEEKANDEVLTLRSKVKRLEGELESKNERIESLLKDVDTMKAERDKAVKEYYEMKKQLENIKNALNQTAFFFSSNIFFV